MQTGTFFSPPQNKPKNLLQNKKVYIYARKEFVSVIKIFFDILHDTRAASQSGHFAATKQKNDYASYKTCPK